MPILVTGKTFQHREALHRMGGKWQADKSGWLVPDTTPADKLNALVGCLWSAPTPAPVSISWDVAADDTGGETIVTEREGHTTFYGNDRTHFGRFAGGDPVMFAGFESLHDLVDFIRGITGTETDDMGRWAGWCEDSDQRRWFGTRSMREALDLALNGWPEGVDAAAETLEIIASEHAQRRKRTPVIAGGRVSVGRMLSGDPLHMTRRTRQPGQKIVTLFVNIAAASTIKAETLAVRAATIAAMCDALEQAEYSCEIVAYDYSMDRRGNQQMTINLKQAGEPLDIESLVFTLGHPSMLRRLCFAVMSVPECRHMWEHFGMPTDGFTKRHPTNPNEFHISQTVDNPSGSTFAEQVRNMFPMIVPDGFPVSLTD